MVKIKNRNEILNDVIKDGKKHPKNWKAVFGKDPLRMSNDYYIFHPNKGVYLLKEYQKNPLQIKGIGGKIARKIDDDIEDSIIKKSDDFGIIQGDFRKITKNIKKGIHPDKILKSAYKGKKDYGLKIPVKGKASNSEKTFKDIKNNLSTDQKKINSKFEEIAEKEGLYKNYS
jgi:hypothetical protein